MADESPNSQLLGIDLQSICPVATPVAHSQKMVEELARRRRRRHLGTVPSTRSGPRPPPGELPKARRKRAQIMVM